MQIKPYIIGRGGSAMAMKKSLSAIGLLYPQIKLAPTVEILRGAELHLDDAATTPVLFIANPHGLHTRYIVEGERAGFRWMIVEKPVCVSLEQAAQLEKITAQVSICHGYRQMWGPQQIASLIQSGELGEIISVEGRYWQSSAAEWSLSGALPGTGWKNDPTLSGPFDVLLDLGTHWADLMFFFAGTAPESTRLWLNHANGEASHRDTHVHLFLDFRTIGHTFGSISKTAHGAGNELSFTVIGTKGSAYWNFESPDQLQLGRGRQLSIVARPKSENYGSQQAPFHGMGWIEGYIEIIAQTLLAMMGEPAKAVPSLAEGLRVARTLLNAV